MKIFILTGSIAMGKTTIANIFKDYGINIFCADEQIHYLYKQQHIIDYVKLNFPDSIKNAQINRKILAGYILNNSTNREKLEKFLYKFLDQAKIKFLDQNKNNLAVMLDIPLYFEKGATKYIGTYKIDKIIVVFSSKEQQKLRALKRPNLSIENFENILKLQMPIEEKLALADYAINNDKSLEYTKQQIEEILKKENLWQIVK